MINRLSLLEETPSLLVGSTGTLSPRDYLGKTSPGMMNTLMMSKRILTQAMMLLRTALSLGGLNLKMNSS